MVMAYARRYVGNLILKSYPIDPGDDDEVLFFTAVKSMGIVQSGSAKDSTDRTSPFV
jgi:hypothetical protein